MIVKFRGRVWSMSRNVHSCNCKFLLLAARIFSLRFIKEIKFKRAGKYPLYFFTIMGFKRALSVL